MKKNTRYPISHYSTLYVIRRETDEGVVYWDGLNWISEVEKAKEYLGDEAFDERDKLSKLFLEYRLTAMRAAFAKCKM